MLISLRPELRAAQRVLRVISSEKSLHTRTVTRSFSNFSRLRAPPSPDQNRHVATQNTEKAESTIKDKADQNSSSWSQLKGWLADKVSESRDGTTLAEPASTSRSSGETKEHRDIPSTKEASTEKVKERIDSLIEKGTIPPGYLLIERYTDIPEDKLDVVNEHCPEFPFLLAESRKKQIPVVPLPEDFAVDNATHTTEHDGAESNTQSNVTLGSSEDAPSTLYGSASARRMRAKASHPSPYRVIQERPKSMPSWFLEHNVSLAGRDRPIYKEDVFLRRVERVLKDRGRSDGEPMIKRRKIDDQSTTDKQPNNTVPTDNNAPNFKSTAEVTSSDHLSDKNQYSYLKTYSLEEKPRYYMNYSQAQEVFATIRGRLHRPPTSSKLRSANDLSLKHVTINFARPSEAPANTAYANGYFEALISDIADESDADVISIDAQDMSGLIASADVDQEVRNQGSHLSYKIAKGLNEDQFTNLNSEVTEIEEDDEGETEDDDVDSSRSTFDLPISGIVAIPGGGFPKGTFGGLNGGLGGYGRIIDQMRRAVDKRITEHEEGIFMPICNQVLASPSHKSGVESIANDPKDSSKGHKNSSRIRPLIVHVANYRSWQQNRLSAQFLSDLVLAAEKQTSQGHRVIIVGTDCLPGEEPVNVPRMMQEQASRPFENASNIVVTSCLPEKDARNVYVQDLAAEFYMVNLRHIWSALRDRGISMQDMPSFFWRDQRPNARESLPKIKDIRTDSLLGYLTKQCLPYLEVQRLVSVLAAHPSVLDTSRVDHDLLIWAYEIIDDSNTSRMNWTKDAKGIKSLKDQKKKQTERRERGEAESEEEPTNTINLAQIRKKATRHEKKLLSGVIEPRKINTTFKDIHIAKETVEALQTLTTLSLVRPEAFRYGVLKSDRIPGLLLYGPPGTGKTLAAKAVAKESGATMLEVSAADLNDMYVGEGEKNVQALFSLAKKLSPCVVFLDEADAMFSARSAGGRRVSHRELLNQFLKEWDGMSNDSGSAFIMVATNRPMDLDDAVLRRLPRRLLVDLPSEADRLEILKIHLRHEVLKPDVDIASLAKRTPFYSGSDLKNVAVAAALAAVREENEAARKHKESDPSTEYKYPDKRELTTSHFEKALDEISASISEDMSSLKELKKFDEQYGDRKGRKKKSPKWGFISASEADKVLDTVKVRDVPST